MADFNKNILIVEDDGVLLSVLANKLSFSHSVDDAIDGEIGLKKLDGRKYDLVILDLMIPMVNGYQMLETIRSSSNPDVANVPIIILSNLAGQESIERAKAYNILEYFIKSTVSAEEVAAKAEDVLSGQ